MTHTNGYEPPALFTAGTLRDLTLAGAPTGAVDSNFQEALADGVITPGELAEGLASAG